MKQLQEFIILSAELSVSDEWTNHLRSRRLEGMLIDLQLPYKKVGGVYKGVKEVSFMVIVKDEAEIQTVKDLGLVTFEQESVLFRNFKGNAKLIFKDETSVDLGKFKQGFSYDAMTIVDGKAWVCC